MAYLWWIIFLPILDLLLLGKMPALLGGTVVLIWLAAAALLGILAIRTRGFRLRQPPPGEEPEVLDRVLVFIAGLLLVFPGPASDVLGLALLMPAVRRRVLTQLLGTFLARTLKGAGPFRPRPASPSGERPEMAPGSGQTREKYPGAERARDVEFEAARQSEELKTNKR